MTTELQLSVIEKVKKALGITDELETFELYDLLYNTRNNCHPDKYIDEEIKKKAEEQFKEFSSLLKELEFHISQEKLSKRPSDIVLYQEKYEVINLRIQLRHLENEIKELKNESKSLKDQKESLEKSLETRENNDLTESQNELANLYKPKKISLIAASITTFLLFTINIVSNLNSLKDKIITISPIDTKYINIALFGALVIMVLNMIFQRRKLLRVKNIADEIISSNVIKDFHNQYSTKKKSDYSWERGNYYFMENDVTVYIKNRYCNRRYLKSIAYYIEGLFVIKDYKSINNLKDIFIYNLISKKLISIGSSKELDREFVIK